MTLLLRSLLPLLLTTAVFAQSADLFVGATGAATENRFQITMALGNNGPAIARATVLTVDVPPGVTVERFSYGSGDVADKPCDLAARPIRCVVGDLHVGLPYHYGGLDLRAPVADATYAIKFALTSETPDAAPANNSATVVWETKVEADVSVSIETQTDRVDPGGAGTFTAYICNNISGNRPPTVRAEFTATNGVITRVTPPTGFTCRDEGTKTVCTIAELPHGCPQGKFDITVRASEDRRGGDVTLAVQTFSDVPERNPANDQATRSFAAYRWLSVNTTADSGPGSLRDAINEANAGCSPGPCRIVFEIPGPVPSEGWFTITPAEPLPSITAERVTLEGNRQTAFTGNTNPRGPEIAIDGQLARRGIRMLATCEGVVNGLAIGNFDEDQGLWVSTGGDCRRPDRREVTDNHIGMDPSGNVPWPNLRGLRADFSVGLLVTRNVISNNRYSGIWLWRGTAASIISNFIDANGASGMLLGPEVISANVSDNVIRRHPQMGIAVARDAKSVQMRRNQMQDNGGLAIDWGLDGVSPTGGDDRDAPTNAPVLLSARYDAATNQTMITFSITTTKLGRYVNFGTFDAFVNDTPDGDGERFIGTRDHIFATGTTTVGVDGDHRGKWINATWTRRHEPAFARRPPIDTHSHETWFAALTSELSNAVLVE